MPPASSTFNATHSPDGLHLFGMLHYPVSQPFDAEGITTI